MAWIRHRFTLENNKYNKKPKHLPKPKKQKQNQNTAAEILFSQIKWYYIYINQKTPYKNWVLKKLTEWCMILAPHIDFQWSAIITVIVIIKKIIVNQKAAYFVFFY